MANEVIHKFIIKDQSSVTNKKKTIMVTPQYTSLEEKQRVFAKRYCIITTTSEFKDWYEEHKIRKDVKHIFRGIKEASYKNYTSAQVIKLI